MEDQQPLLPTWRKKIYLRMEGLSNLDQRRLLSKIKSGKRASVTGGVPCELSNREVALGGTSSTQPA